MSDGHDLVIGGSGMLAALVEQLAGSGREVTVIARGRERLERLAARSASIHPQALNYRDPAALERGLAEARRLHGPIRRCVAWMHGDDLARAITIARDVEEVHCQVLGSASADPARPEQLARWQAAFRVLDAPVLRLAILGFVVENGGSRWLSDGEISEGVGRALQDDEPVTIIGTVTPWSARP